MCNVKKLNININEYNKQLNYFKTYYGADFRRGQGTEVILEVIHNYSQNGTLVDFGSGSNIYFWLTAFKNVTNVLCVDICKEAFYINEKIRKKELYPKSCEYALNKYCVNFDSILNKNIDYLVCDIFKSEIKMIKKYDNVTQFGLLGLCKSQNEYTSNLKKISKFLTKGGILIGANWHFSPWYSAKMKFNNDYLSTELINIFAQNNNYQILFNKTVQVKNDKNYDSILIYALRNE